MSFSLFEQEPNPPGPGGSTVEEPAVSLAQRVAQTYMAGLRKAIAHKALIERMKVQEYASTFDPFSRVFGSVPSINALHQQVFEAIVRGAKDTGLAAPGEYEINSDDFDAYLTGLNGRGGYGVEETVKTDILGLCIAIEAKFGGAHGQKAELRRAAKNIVQEFNLATTEIEVKSGMVEFRIRTWLRKSYRNRYEWDYSDRARLARLTRDLGLGLAVSGMSLHFPELDPMITAHSGYSVVEPGRTSFDGVIYAGDLGDQPIRVKVQKDHQRWRFTKACADAISDFVSQYGND